MLKIKSIVVFAAVIGLSVAKGQTCTGYVQPANELVQNGAMDYFSKPCVNLDINNGPFYPCCLWTYPLSANTTSAILASDYYNACAPIPTNNVMAGNSVNASINKHNFIFGSPPTAAVALSPHSGSGYSGIAVCQSTVGTQHREYISSQLVSTLQVGATYQFSMWVRLSPDSQYGIQNLSVMFSNAPAVQGTAGSVGLLITPSAGDLIVPLSNSPVTEKTAWVQLTANVPIPIGSSFSHITIGNFSTNSGTTILSAPSLGTSHSEFSYYFVDDVSLKLACGSPILSAPSTMCANSTLILNGSATTGMVAAHVYTIVESDPLGNPATGATEWWSNWSNTHPGSYSVPSYANGGPNMVCGKYYRIKLAIGNICSNWVETTKVIYVYCPPTANAGADQTICAGTCVNLSAPGPIKHHTYSWVIMNDEPTIIGSGQTINVCPTQTTTYCVNVTNNLTGCTSYDCMTITVETANPGFGVTALNTTGASFWTVTMTPNQTTNLPAGFQHLWVVEELNASQTATAVFDKWRKCSRSPDDMLGNRRSGNV